MEYSKAMTPQPDTFIFVMAGGSGERFWPLSRKKKPKQLLSLFSDLPLLAETLKRVDGLAPESQTLVLTNHEQVQVTLEALRDFPESRIVAEPTKRDTAPAAALATALAYSQNPEAVVVLLPSDQLVKDASSFRKNLQDSILLAANSESIVTLAIPPTHASTGFGYLELGDPVNAGNISTQFRRVSRFVEKPSLEKAREYLDSGRFSWNAGIFAWKASTFLKEARRLSPLLADFVEKFPKETPAAYIQKYFPELPKISVDYAVMEKASSIVAAAAEFDWDDIGCWTSLGDHMPMDSLQNVVQGPASLLEASGNIVFSPKKHVALCGVSGLVIVETDDALLICHRDKVQDIKKILGHLPAELL